MRRPSRTDERGDTLIELLVAIMIMGVAVVTIVGAIANAVMLSGTHRRMTTTGDDVRTFAEYIEASVAASPSGYVPCAGTSAYGGGYTPPGSDGGTYTASVTAVSFWDGPNGNFLANCVKDSGVQRLLLRVSTSDGSVSENLAIIIRKPCRPGDAACS
jgi:hypothetical protein